MPSRGEGFPERTVDVVGSTQEIPNVEVYFKQFFHFVMILLMKVLAFTLVRILIWIFIALPWKNLTDRVIDMFLNALYYEIICVPMADGDYGLYSITTAMPPNAITSG